MGHPVAIYQWQGWRVVPYGPQGARLQGTLWLQGWLSPCGPTRFEELVVMSHHSRWRYLGLCVLG